MVGTSLTPARAAAAARHLATLRGLYGDLGDALNDPGLRRTILAQISSEQDQLSALLRPAGGAPRTD